MITAEWRRLLEGKEPFEDVDVEKIVSTLKERMAAETDTLRLVELHNMLELALGSGEWLTRKAKRLELALEEIIEPKEKEALEEKIKRVKQRRDEVVATLKAKLGLS